MIYPLDTNDCYYNYSPKDGINFNRNKEEQMAVYSKIQGHNQNESTHNLNELLESLNKSDKPNRKGGV